MKSIIKACLLISLLVALLPAPALAQGEIVCESDVIVQAGDWLSKIAADAYGDPLAYPAIVEATNQKALADGSYASVEDPALIEPGWKLCLPGAEAVRAAMADETEAAATAASPTTAEQEAALGEAGVVQVTLLQLNDIYELTPVSGGAELAIFNGGSVRIDDVVPPGNVTEYDVIRILPFGGVVLSAEMKGSLLQQVLDQGQANRGNGGYLQTANVSRDEAGSAWQINNEPLDTERVYLVAINDFLLTGNEQGLAFLNRDNAAVTVVGEHADIRFALINQLKRQYGAN